MRTPVLAAASWLLLAAVSGLLGAGAARAQDETDKRTREGDAAVEAAVRAATAKVAPSIVEIETLGAMPDKVADPKEDPNGPGGTSEGVLVKRGFKQAFGPSTGIALGKELVLTSTFAFQREPRHIFVTRSDGKSFVAKLLGRDEGRMIALLEVPGADLAPAPEAKTEATRVGRTALAIGRGYGVPSPTVSQGIVSAIGRASGRAIQTSANVSPACYGGPLVSIDGEVMGVIVPLAGMGGQAGVELYDSGIGFAIPMDDVHALLPRLEKGETLKPAFLGITIDMGRTEDGVEVESVEHGSAADAAGLEKNDIIREIDGKPIKGSGHLNQTLGRHLAGDRITLTVERNGAISEFEAVLGEPPQGGPEGHPHVPNMPGPGQPPQPGPGGNQGQ